MDRLTDSPQPVTASNCQSLSPMILTLVGLFGGLLIGFVIHRWPRPELLAFVSLVEPAGLVWSNALQMTLIPLVVSQLICGIGTTAGYTTAGHKAVGRLSGLSLLIFVVMLAAGSVFTMFAAPSLVARFKVDPAEMAALQASASGQTSSRTASGRDDVGNSASFGAGIVALMPSNPIKAAADGAMLPLIVFTILFALAITRIAVEQRQSLLRFFQALGETAFVLVRWVLKPMPVGVFALALPMAANAGGVTIGAIGYFVFLDCLIALGLTLLLYPAALLFGRVNIRRFARSLAQAQAVAVSSRSSLAALPAMLDGANRWLHLPATVTGFVLPLCVSVFKASQPGGHLVKLLFIAHLYGVQLDPLRIAVFTVTVTVISFGVAGLPGTGTMKSIPAYLASGIPLEAILFFNAVDAIPDIFRTLANVTGDVTALTIVARLAGVSAPGATGANISNGEMENPLPAVEIDDPVGTPAG
ncbi:MAG: Proton/glutamate-aspartate symporter [Acidobacteria bacterium]|nr:Proton/glutamate-aspartate symporter [Acidobacteriota bacterium]